MRLLRRAAIVAAEPRIFLLSTGVSALFKCSGEGCTDEPLAEVVVTYHRGGVVSTLWCVEHLPNLHVMHSAPEVAGVELVSTVRGA